MNQCAKKIEKNNGLIEVFVNFGTNQRVIALSCDPLLEALKPERRHIYKQLASQMVKILRSSVLRASDRDLVLMASVGLIAQGP